MISVSVFERFT